MQPDVVRSSPGPGRVTSFALTAPSSYTTVDYNRPLMYAGCQSLTSVWWFLQILKLLGDVSNKRVLELGAGIGRFTIELASTAKSVHALDFMKTFIDANKEATGKFGNVTHEVGSHPCPQLHVFPLVGTTLALQKMLHSLEPATLPTLTNRPGPRPTV